MLARDFKKDKLYGAYPKKKVARMKHKKRRSKVSHVKCPCSPLLNCEGSIPISHYSQT